MTRQLVPRPPHSVAAAVDELRTVLDLLRWGSSRFSAAGLFFGHGTDSAWDEASTLVLHALSLPPDADPRVLDARLTRAERGEVAALLQRRIDERLPAPYLTGEAWFAGLSFAVNQHVLVPRSPIAELIAESFEPWLGLAEAGREPESVLDIGTGSGCIAIACALSFPTAQVDAVDISREAIAVARENIERYGLRQQVRALQSDLFAELGDRRYDLIVSNPPYVDRQAMEALPAEFQREPELGLAAGEDGLDVVARILAGASAHLRPDGLLVVEVGDSRAALEQRFPSLPFLWPEFEQGGHGVFVLSAADLATGLVAGGEGA